MTVLTEPSIQWGISRNFGPDGHNGVDYKYPFDTPVYAAADGTVTFEGWGQNHSWITWMGGISILLNHGDIYSGYSHLNSSIVNQGQRVKAGQLIGYSASTGNSTGPHLHFDVLPQAPNFKNGYSGRINPNPYFNNAPQVQGDEGDMPTNYQVARIYAQALLLRDMSEEEYNKFHAGKSRNQLFDDFNNSDERRVRLADLNDAIQTRSTSKAVRDELAYALAQAAEAQSKVAALVDENETYKQKEQASIATGNAFIQFIGILFNGFKK